MSRNLTSLNDIRKDFISYFIQNNHQEVRSSPLVPHNDPTLMFTNSGMVQFKNLFTGLEKRNYSRATSSQRCIRAGGKHNDLENVGYTARHHTFFEMLGNFSFGDYFKEEAIYYAWEFLTKTLGLNKDKLYATIYHTDEEAYQYWKKISGFSDSKIIRINTNDNFWSMGDTGPCGPCSEVFYDHGDHIWGGLPGTKEQDGDRYIEIWNMVFMQYEQIDANTRINLPKQSIDTGMGLERIAAVMQGVHDNYDTDLFKSLIKASESITSKGEEYKFSHRIISDHLRSSVFLIADGVMPSNEGRGYVLRRIMRRAMCQAHLLGAKDPMMHLLVDELVNLMGSAYPEIVRARDVVKETLKSEETRFKTTLEKGLKLLEQYSDIKILNGDVAFKLYDTFGFPLDLTQAILRPKNIEVDIDGFHRNMNIQKEKARQAWNGSGESKTDSIWFDLQQKYGSTEFLGYNFDSAEAKALSLIQHIGSNLEHQTQVSESGTEFLLLTNQTPFYAESGGQIGDIGTILGDNNLMIEVLDTKKYLGSLHLHSCILKTGQIKQADNIILNINIDYRNNLRKHHSATHILHFALKKILGNHITQKGSLVSHNKLRFDISHNKAITQEELKQIEILVNQIIMQNDSTHTKLMTLDEAMNSGATALFGEKYSEEVRVVQIGPDSIELCGGTHVKSAGDIGQFKIISESAIAAGVRRIEAVCGFAALDYIQKTQEKLSTLATNLNVGIEELQSKTFALVKEHKALTKELQTTYLKLFEFSDIDFNNLKNNKIGFKYCDQLDSKITRICAENATKKYQDIAVIYATRNEDKLSLIISSGAQSNISAVDISQKLIAITSGNGGGNQKLGQVGAVFSQEIFNKLLKMEW